MFHFFYDETEHSRCVNYPTVTADNYYDFFCTAMIGWNANDEQAIAERYYVFEKKYLDRSVNGEIKSSTIKPSNYTYGFASFSQDNALFLNDFFSIFDEKVYVHLSFCNKAEFIIQQMFDNELELCDEVCTDRILYALVKTLIINKPKEALKLIFDGSPNFRPELIKYFNHKIRVNKQNLTLKQEEIAALRNLRDITHLLTIPHSFTWDYKQSFYDFSNFLNELSITNYSLCLDREGSQKTLTAAKNVGIKNVNERDSKSCFGIRMADMFAGVFSRLMKAVYADIHHTDVDNTDFKTLSLEWFSKLATNQNQSLNQNKIQLYERLYRILFEMNNPWNKTSCGIYGDDLSATLSLISFIHFNHDIILESPAKAISEYENQRDYALRARWEKWGMYP